MIHYQRIFAESLRMHRPLEWTTGPKIPVQAFGARPAHVRHPNLQWLAENSCTHGCTDIRSSGEIMAWDGSNARTQHYGFHLHCGLSKRYVVAFEKARDEKYEALIADVGASGPQEIVDCACKPVLTYIEMKIMGGQSDCLDLNPLSRQMRLQAKAAVDAAHSISESFQRKLETANLDIYARDGKKPRHFVASGSYRDGVWVDHPQVQGDYVYRACLTNEATSPAPLAWYGIAPHASNKETSPYGPGK